MLFFKGGEYGHTGLVENVANGVLHTIEGNTSGASGIIPNGGGVCRKQYALSDLSSNTKYFRPDYSIVDGGVTPDPTPDPTPYRPMLRKGDRGNTIAEAQKLLNDNGASLDVDGDFGNLTLAAVKDFQKRHLLEVDGIVGEKTWYCLDHQAMQVKKTPGVIRKEPRKASKMVEKLVKGTKVRIYEAKYNDLVELWYRVADGWIIGNNVTE